jgi:hypothetical protein
MRLIWAIIPLVLTGVIGIQESFAESTSNEKQPKLNLEIDNQFPVIGDDIKFTIINKGPKDAIFNFELLDSNGLAVPISCFDNPNTKDLLPPDFSRSVTWNQKNCKDFLKSDTFLFNSYLTIDNKLSGFVSAIEFEVYSGKQPIIEIPPEIPQTPVKKVLTIDEIPIIFGDRGYTDSGLISNKNSNARWETTNFLVSDNGDYEINLKLYHDNKIPDKAGFFCTYCVPDYLFDLKNVNFIGSAAFLQVVANNEFVFYGDISHEPLSKIIPIMLDSENEEFEQGTFQGNFNATLFMNPPPEFEPNSLSFELSWARFFVDSNGHEYIQWFNSDTQQNTKFNSITNLNGTFREFTPISEFSRTNDYVYFDTLAWFDENVSKDEILTIMPNHQLNTGSFSIQRMHYSYDIEYEITNGNQIINIIDRAVRNPMIVVSVLSYTDGQANLFLPKHLVNPTGCENEIKITGNTSQIQNFTVNDIDNNILEIQIPFSEKTNSLLIMALNSNNNEVCDTSIDDLDTKNLLSPKKQISIGVPPIDIICKEGLELIFKSSDNSPVCVKPETAMNLIERGWGEK